MAREPQTPTPPDPSLAGDLKDEALWRRQSDETDRLGQRIVSTVHAIEKAVRLYEPNNRVVVRLLDELVSAVGEGTREGGSLCLEARDETILLNDAPFRMGYKTWKLARELGQSLLQRGVRRLEIPEGTTRPALQLLFARLARVHDAAAPEGAQVLAHIQAETRILVGPAPRLVDVPADVEADRAIVRYYADLTVLVRDLMDATRAGKRITLVPLKRIIQLIADALPEREALLLTLLDLPAWRGHLETHVANVVVLALALGRRLELAPERLLSLGLAAAHHDLAQAFVPPDLSARVERGEALSTVEEQALATAPYRATAQLLKAPDLAAPDAVARLATVYENRQDFVDLPESRGGLTPSAVGRLLAVLNAYDLLVRPVGPWEPLMPAEALRWMLQENPDRFDATALHTLVRVLGLFPTGSLVELASGEIAVVVGQHGEDGLAGSPIVDLLTNHEGEPIKPVRIDLAEGHHPIRAPLDPQAHGFDALQHFLRPTT